jgi:hypothetical protein
LASSGQLATGDQKNLRAACRNLKSAIEPLLFSLTMRLSKTGLNGDMLVQISSGNSRCFRCARTLTILPGKIRATDTEVLGSETRFHAVLGAALPGFTSVHIVVSFGAHTLTAYAIARYKTWKASCTPT